MIIFNSSFMVEREREAEFINWLGIALRNIDSGDNLAARRLRVSAMREAGGVDYREAETQTVAMQLEFATIEEARDWSAGKFATLAARFEEAFGPQALVFTSLFETVRQA